MFGTPQEHPHTSLPLKTHEEELAYLRRQVEEKEQQLHSLKERATRGEVVQQQLQEHKRIPASTILAPSYTLPEPEVERLALSLSPEADDETMEELRRIMEAKGIHNAFSVLTKLNSPHLEDDFHRYLVAYVMAGMKVKGIEERGPTFKALNMTLYEVSLPEPGSGTEQKERSQSLKELISGMEQFYAGMLAIETPYAGEPAYLSLELAVPADRAHLTFYVTVPNGRRDLFEKQLLAIFPDAQITPEHDDFNIFAQEGETLASIATLKEKPMLSLKEYTEFDYDPLNSILNAFAKIENEGEGAVLQIIFKPEGGHFIEYYKKVLKALRKGEKKARAFSIPENVFGEIAREAKDIIITPSEGGHPDEAAIQSVEKKIQTPVVATNMRLLVSSPSKERAGQILNELESAFNQFENTQGNKIVWKHTKGSELKRVTHEFSYRLFAHAEKLPLSLRELTTIYHFPGKGIRSSPHLKQSRFTGSAAPVDLPKEGVLLGENRFRGMSTEVRLSSEDRLRHLYVIGQTGTGKSGFLQTLIEQDMRNGEGVCFIDPHGKDVIDVLAMVPPERYEDVIYFDPAYIDRPFGLNMLEYDPRYPEQKTFIVNELLAIFRRLYGDVPESMGPAFEQYFRNATQLVMEDPETGSTMLDIARVLADSDFRDMKLEKSKNPVVNMFWNDIATRAGGEASLENIVPYITNKFDDFTGNDFMRPIIGQQESSFKFREVIDSKKILLVNLSKGRLGEKNANLIGLILVGKLFMAALSRADSPSTAFPPFYLYIDEFQNITTDSIPNILSEARKYKLSLTIAHQFLKQIDEKARNAIFGNVGSMTVFRVGEDDAELFEKQFTPTFSALDFVNIENRNAYVKMLARGVPQKPFNIKTTTLPEGNRDQVDDLRELSYLTYGRDRETVESTIRSRYLGGG